MELRLQHHGSSAENDRCGDYPMTWNHGECRSPFVSSMKNHQRAQLRGTRMPPGKRFVKAGPLMLVGYAAVEPPFAHDTTKPGSHEESQASGSLRFVRYDHQGCASAQLKRIHRAVESSRHPLTMELKRLRQSATLSRAPPDAANVFISSDSCWSSASMRSSFTVNEPSVI